MVRNQLINNQYYVHLVSEVIANYASILLPARFGAISRTLLLPGASKTDY